MSNARKMRILVSFDKMAARKKVILPEGVVETKTIRNERVIPIADSLQKKLQLKPLVPGLSFFIIIPFLMSGIATIKKTKNWRRS